MKFKKNMLPFIST